MKDRVKFKSGRVRGAAVAAVASTILAAGAIHANPSERTVLVPPADLPEMARQGGEAMLLLDAKDGRTLLYVEQDQGASLAIFDVTDPLHIKGEGAVQLNAPAPFDFVTNAGNQAELVRYRDGGGVAVLDLHNVKGPVLKTGGTEWQGAAIADKDRRQVTNADTGTTFKLGEDGLTVIRRPAVEMIE